MKKKDKLYGVVYRGELIAIHERKKVVKLFIKDFFSSDSDVQIIKMGNVNELRLAELYLVPYKKSFYPQEYANIVDEMDYVSTHDTNFVIEFLLKHVEIHDKKLSDKDIRAFQRVISNLVDVLRDNDADYEAIVTYEKLMSDYRYAVDKD